MVTIIVSRSHDVMITLLDITSCDHRALTCGGDLVYVPYATRKLIVPAYNISTGHVAWWARHHRAHSPPRPWRVRAARLGPGICGDFSLMDVRPLSGVGCTVTCLDGIGTGSVVPVRAVMRCAL